MQAINSLFHVNLCWMFFFPLPTCKSDSDLFNCGCMSISVKVFWSAHHHNNIEYLSPCTSRSHIMSIRFMSNCAFPFHLCITHLRVFSPIFGFLRQLCSYTFEVCLKFSSSLTVHWICYVHNSLSFKVNYRLNYREL